MSSVNRNHGQAQEFHINDNVMAYDEPLDTGDDYEPAQAMNSFKDQAALQQMQISPRKASKKSIK